MCQCAGLEDGGTELFSCVNCGREIAVSAEKAAHWPVFDLRNGLVVDPRPSVSTVAADWWPIGLTVDKQGRCHIGPVEQMDIWREAA